MTEKGLPAWGPGWRIGHRRWDWLRSIRCLLTGHRWEVNYHETQRVCPGCATAQDRLPAPAPTCPGQCIAHIDCENGQAGCNYPEPHIHGFACDKACTRCHGRGIPVSDPESHPNHAEWRGRS